MRDLGEPAPPNYDVRRQASKNAKYARLVTAGSPITAEGGVPIAVFGMNSSTINGPESATQTVNDMLDQGADLIKIYLTTWRDTFPTLSDEEVAAIVQATHQRGTVVSVHVNTSEELERAIKGGVDDFAHRDRFCPT